jgi:DNA-binding transcriptional MocR family regulator
MRDELLGQCAGQDWARAGNRTRYGRLADTIALHIEDGTWKPGRRMPSAWYLARTYQEQEKTVRRTLFILTVRVQLSRDRLALQRRIVISDPAAVMGLAGSGLAVAPPV